MLHKIKNNKTKIFFLLIFLSFLGFTGYAVVKSYNQVKDECLIVIAEARNEFKTSDDICSFNNRIIPDSFSSGFQRELLIKDSQMLNSYKQDLQKIEEQYQSTKKEFDDNVQIARILKIDMYSKEIDFDSDLNKTNKTKEYSLQNETFLKNIKNYHQEFQKLIDETTVLANEAKDKKIDLEEESIQIIDSINSEDLNPKSFEMANISIQKKEAVLKLKQQLGIKIKTYEQEQEQKRLAIEAQKQQEDPTPTLPDISKQVQIVNSNVNCDISKCIAITFDDGPKPSTTNRLLDILEERNVPATFYVLGQMIDKHPDIIKDMHARGHEIGNHTQNHKNLTKISPTEIEAEIDKVNKSIYNLIGYYPSTMRPPYGAVNDNVTKYSNLPIVNWSIDPYDWRDRNSDTVASRVVNSAKPGAIILLHDIHSTTVDATPKILDHLIAKGYVFVTVSHLLDIDSQDLPVGVIYRHR